MLSPKYQEYADRISDLAEEGKSIASLGDSENDFIRGVEKIPLHSWLAKADNILRSAVGIGSAHYEHFEDVRDGGVARAKDVYRLVGILEGAVDDLEQGFLIGQEFLIAGDIFDSVLEQARHLKEKQHKAPAAVLGRVVLEDALRRIAQEEGVDVEQKASQINTDLRKAERYPKPQWRRVQSWLDVGNEAAHGNFSEYTDSDVEDQLDGVEKFLANQLRR